MRIDKLTLTNFRGLTNSTLDFAPGFNLIIGINGAGKTAVLDALRILLARALPDLAESRPFHGIGLTKEDITVGRGQTYIQFKISSRNQIFSLALSEQRDVTRNAVDSKTGLKDIRDVEELPRLRHGERPERGDLRLEGTLRGQTSNRPEVVGILEPEPTRSFKKSRPQPLVLYLSVRRAIENGRVSRASGSPAYQNIFENDRGLELKRLADWWKGREELAHEASQSQSGKQLAAITGALARLLPHLSDWRIENKALTVCKIVDVEQMNDRGEKIFVNESRRLVVGFLSDGERSLIAIGADIARRLALLNGESESPLDDGEGVVLIDELDLHLHPQWQRTVVESLRTAFPRIQFICTTHSLFLIQSQRYGNLIRLDAVGKEEEPAEQYQNMSIEDIAEEVQGVAMPQRSQWHFELMKMSSVYYRRLKDAELKKDLDIDRLKRELDAISLRYSNDPFVAATLDFKWETFIEKRRKDETS